MIHTKRVIFFALPLLFVPMAYGISSTPDACAVAQDPGYSEGSCGATTYNPTRSHYQKTCCWEELVPGKLPPLNRVTYCQTCYVQTDQVARDCDEKVAQLQQPLTGPLTPGNLQNLPTLEQVPTTPTPPPLFGQDTNVPPSTGGIVEQPPTAAPTEPTPGGVPTDQGPEEQPTTPQDDQDDNQGGVLPNIQSRPNIQSEGEITEQPENEESQNEDDGQEEGAETAGPLT